MLTAEKLRDVMDYEPDTGTLRWRVSLSSRGPVGSKAGVVHRSGYVFVGIDGKKYLAHRLAWLHVHGRWPEKDIDHINGVKTDNRIANLRDVGASVNMQNVRRARADNKSGLLGVRWSQKAKKWGASIGLDGEYKWLGFHSTPEEAHAAYVEAKRRLHEGGTI